MASCGIIKSSFLPLHKSHENASLLSSSASNLSNTKQKFSRVAASLQEKSSETNDLLVKTETEKNKGIARKLDFSGNKPSTPLLDTINYPAHMKNLSLEDLERLADELREEIVYVVSKTGGHLSSSLGVTELTVALHHVFNSPEDKIIWDVGHQAYMHKILTGRRSKMSTIRQTFGLAGFPKREESAHDAFGAGHSSTSISAGLGMAVARDLLGKDNHVISVIGDGAMTAGQAYEALNNAGFLDSNLIIVLNDNKQVSLPTATIDGPAPPVGALTKALSKLQSGKSFRQLPAATNGITKQIGGEVHEVAAKLDTLASGMTGSPGASLFEELGIFYIGPVDGHSIDDLIYIFKQIKEMPASGPVMVHIVTEKGKGYPPAEAAADKMHGVVKFEPSTGKQIKSKPKTLSYTQYFAESLIAEAAADDKIVAVHAAMGGGTGLNFYQKHFPERCFDVGIAEQHAVTFAAGLATEGLKPFCAIYSSFLQRGYDQVVHDVDLQKLPVRFIMDRAGLVGADGPTHCGAFDTAFMACLPNMVVMAPSDEAELMHMIATAAKIDDRPSCIRYPRGNGVGVVLPKNNKGTPLEVGKGRILKEGSRVAILGFGTIVQTCLAASQLLGDQGIDVTVADARFCKPLDGELISRGGSMVGGLGQLQNTVGGGHASNPLGSFKILDPPLLIRQLVKEHEVLITIEEGSIGGFSSHVGNFLCLNGLLDGNLKWRAMGLPDRYIEHGSQDHQIEEAGLSSKHIAATVLSLIGDGKNSLRSKNL